MKHCTVVLLAGIGLALGIKQVKQPGGGGFDKSQVMTNGKIDSNKMFMTFVANQLASIQASAFLCTRPAGFVSTCVCGTNNRANMIELGTPRQRCYMDWIEMRPDRGGIVCAGIENTVWFGCVTWSTNSIGAWQDAPIRPPPRPQPAPVPRPLPTQRPTPPPTQRPLPTPACNSKSSPAGDGDCKCDVGLTCFEGGTKTCTFSSTARFGFKSDGFYQAPCSNCKCQ